MKFFAVVSRSALCLFILAAGLRVIAENPPRTVSPDVMRRIHEEIRTPCKYGMLLEPADGEMLDNPMVFRHAGAWYMMFIRFDGKGYETWLAKSQDLLSWTRLGCVFKRGEKGTWDEAQADGWPTLIDTRWDGPNTLNTFQGKYWMMYLGGAAHGYETDPLSTGVAWTDDPGAVKQWTRALDRPVLQPSDSDARPFERKTIYKHFTVEDPSRACGGRFVNFYNAKPEGVWQETIGGFGRSAPLAPGRGRARDQRLSAWKARNLGRSDDQAHRRRLGDVLFRLPVETRRQGRLRYVRVFL